MKQIVLFYCLFSGFILTNLYAQDIRIYKCQAQCFDLDFTRRLATSMGEVRASSPHDIADAYRLLSTRCRQKLSTSGSNTSQAFIVKKIRSQHSSSSSSTSSNSSDVAAAGRISRTLFRMKGDIAILGHTQSTVSSSHSSSSELEVEFGEASSVCFETIRLKDEVPYYEGNEEIYGNK